MADAGQQKSGLDAMVDQVGVVLHDYLCFPFASNPKLWITVFWFLSILLVIATTVVSFVLAGREHSTSLGFAAVWTCLEAVALSVGGTVVMRFRQSTFEIGVFLGCVCIMANQCLMLVGIFGSESVHDDGGDGKSAKEERASRDAFTTFAFFLFCIYAAFGFLLAVFRNDLALNGGAPAAAADPQPDADAAAPSADSEDEPVATEPPTDAV